MEDASEGGGGGEGGVFQDLDEVLASLGDVLHAFSNLPYGAVRGVIDEGKILFPDLVEPLIQKVYFIRLFVGGSTTRVCSSWRDRGATQLHPSGSEFS